MAGWPGAVQGGKEPAPGAVEPDAERGRVDPERPRRHRRGEVVEGHEHQGLAVAGRERGQRALHARLDPGRIVGHHSAMLRGARSRPRPLPPLGVQQVAGRDEEPRPGIVAGDVGQAAPGDRHRLGGDGLGVGAAAPAGVPGHGAEVAEDNAEALLGGCWFACVVSCPHLPQLPTSVTEAPSARGTRIAAVGVDVSCLHSPGRTFRRRSPPGLRR